MDFHQEPYQNKYQQPQESKRSPKLATSSMILGIVGTTMSGCIYPGIICGSLAVILSLLSRGGEMKLDNQGKVGLVLGILGIIFAAAFFAFGFYTLIHTYGSFDNFMLEYQEIYNNLMTGQ